MGVQVFTETTCSRCGRKNRRAGSYPEVPDGWQTLLQYDKGIWTLSYGIGGSGLPVRGTPTKDHVLCPDCRVTFAVWLSTAQQQAAPHEAQEA